MTALFVIKVGTTFPDTAKAYGDFEDWTVKGLGVDFNRVRIVDVLKDPSLPLPQDCRGVVVTGSHAMVTDELECSNRISEWIPRLVDSRVPFLGICYGHQLYLQGW